MKMNALSYIIKYLMCLLTNFQAEILKNVEHLEHVDLTTIYIIKRFHFHFRELAPLQGIFLTLTTALLLKALEES